MKHILFLLSLIICSSTIGKTALVTGGAGFLGSHLCDKLINKGYKVICLDNLQTGSLKNIEHLLSHKNFTFLKQDVAQQLFLNFPPLDEIYNMACPASPPHYQMNPIHTIYTCFHGVEFALKLAHQHGAKIFQASTSEIYGNPLEHPQKETYWGNVNTMGPRSCYDEGKRIAETLCYEYHKQFGVSIKIGRIFNTYGPRMDKDDGRCVSNFIVQALQNKPFTLYGNGTQTRSFCYVDDLIEAIYRFMQTDESVTGPLNLGNPEEFTLLQLVELIKEKTNSSSSITFLPLPKDDPVKRKADITKAKATLKWHPKIQLSEEISKTVEYFKVVLKEAT